MIDLGASHAAGRLVVRHVALPAIVALPGVSAGRTDDLAVLPIDNLNVVLRLDLHTGDMPAIGLGSTTDAADLTNGGGYAPPEPLTALREPDGIAVDPSGRFFVTADEGDTRNAAGQSGARGGRTISVFDAQTGAFIADTGTQLDDAAAAVGAYPDQRSNRGWSEAAVHGYSSRAGTK